jgi:signal peptidase I
VTAEKKTRNPFIAALLSLLAPGLGQIYNGKGALGLVFFLISIALPFLWGLAGWPRHFAGLVAFVIADIVFWLFIIVHAFIQARRIRETELKKFQTPGVYAFLVILSLSLMIFVPVRIWMSSLGVSPYRMATASMMPTLQKDDFLMTDPKAYDDQAPKRGDLIVFEYPPDPTKQFLMRVIAFEGETVEIKNKQLFIDGEPLQESYKVHEDIALDNIRDNFGPLKIPAAIVSSSEIIATTAMTAGTGELSLSPTLKAKRSIFIGRRIKRGSARFRNKRRKRQNQNLVDRGRVQ